MTTSRTAFLIRTHRSSWQALDLARRVREHLSENLWFVCDETGGPVATPGFAKIPLGLPALAALGLDRLPEDWGWFCGDCCYYAAASELAGFEYFCLIEEDVFLGAPALEAFGRLLDADRSVAAAARLRRYETPPKYSAGLAAVGADPHAGCIFPVTRVHRDLVPDMLALRRRAQHHPEPLRVNDEGILAAAALASGRPVTDLYDHPEIFAEDRFATNPPHLLEALERAPATSRACHPAVSLADVLRRLADREKNYTEHRLRRIAEEAPAHVAQAIARARAHAESRRRAPEPEPHDRHGPTERLACLLALLPAFSPVHVLDVGANPVEGAAPYAHLLGRGQATVTGFEPNEAVCAGLADAASAQERYLPHALGDGSAGTLHLTRHSGFSSLYHPDAASARHLRFDGSMTVRETAAIGTRRLDDLADIPPVDVLKIDVQGSERAIIANARTTLARALVVQTEVRFFPIYEGEPSFGDLETELRSQGFLFHSFDFLKHARPRTAFASRLRRRAHTQVVDGDGFFVRDLRRMESFTDAELSALCVIADSIMESFDLALMCLDRLMQRGALAEAEVERYLRLVPEGLKRRG